MFPTHPSPAKEAKEVPREAREEAREAKVDHGTGAGREVPTRQRARTGKARNRKMARHPWGHFGAVVNFQVHPRGKGR